MLSEPITLVDVEFARIGLKSLQLDLQIPAHVPTPIPLIVWLFGGGWAGGRRQDRPVVRVVDEQLFREGYAIASLEYRLSHEALFPAQLEDCKAAIRWLRAHAETYHLDATHIGAWGFSSGAHLSALLGTTAGLPEFEGVGQYQQYSSAVQAVCAFAPAIDFLQMSRVPGHAFHDGPTSFESRLVGGPIQDRPAAVARANPITYLTPEAPPFLLLHGDQDENVPLQQSALLYEALQRQGVEATFYVIPNGGHGMHGLSVEETEKIVGMVTKFFDRHLKGIPDTVDTQRLSPNDAE